jgi:predicted acylesterase/phospholipase RssA
MTAQNENPFSDIALCLSGGGYRAAAFHLGVLYYLNRIGLLEKVTILSTVSGGTLTGLTYARSLKKKSGFDTFYKDFYNFLLKTDLVKLSLKHIGLRSDRELGYNNLITSIAEVYESELFKEDRFEIFWDSEEIHLRELIFNATEFKTGIDFRFQKSDNPNALIGNWNINIPVEEAKKILLADIAAASSCFPGGFEPIAFPHDFKWPGNKIPGSLSEQFEEPLPIMDGGIYDNQGIDAALLAITRTGNKIGSFFISDTDQKKENLFIYPKPKKKSRLTLNIVNLISIAVIFLSSLSGIGLTVKFILQVARRHRMLDASLFYAFPAIVLLFLAFAVFRIRRKIAKEVFARIPKVKLASWDYFKKLTIDQIIDMAELRITSLSALASSVFMKRIRGLVFEHVYKDDNYKDKRLSNLIYELNGEKKYNALFLYPSPEMISVTKYAAGMPTTLWFENESDQRKLIACGQYTICYNIIDFIIRIYGTDPNGYPDSIKGIYNILIEDWEKFKNNPMILIG